MKGSGMSYGFEGITNMGLKLEFAAKKQDAERLQTCVDELVDYLKRIEVTY